MLIGILCLAGCFSTASFANNPVIGWLEQVYVKEAKISFEAKIDTGADNSSINAKILKTFDRDGEDWVKFTIKNKAGKSRTMEGVVVRYASIKQQKRAPLERPVIMLELCIGNISRKIEVNLADRSGYQYHMLIGRNFLRGTYSVDSLLEFTRPPSCANM